MITKKHSKLILELGIDPQSVRMVGDVRVGMSVSGAAAYVWRKGEVHEFVAGSIVDFPSISADDIERITDMHFAGKRESTTTFMSASSALHIDIPEPRPAMALPDTSELKGIALIYAGLADALDRTLSQATESISAARQYMKYDGKKVVVDDANDEYDLELTKGDEFAATYLNRDRYEVVLKEDPKIKFIVRGHLRMMNIIGQSTHPKPFGVVATDKVNTFAPVGVVQRRMAQPIQLQKGDVIYSYRKKHYLAQNLAVPLEKILNSNDLDKVLSAVKIESNPKAIAKGKLVGVKLPPLEEGKKLKGVPRAAKVDTVYGAYFPVSANTPNRSRVIFAASQQKVQEEATAIISQMRVPVDYKMFTTLSSDELYGLAKNKTVVIRASGLLDSTYRTSKRVELSLKPQGVAPVYVEPLNGAPEITVPAVRGNEVKLTGAIRRLLTEGYFTTGVRLAYDQPQKAIRFEAPVMDDVTYNQVIGAARRINAYFRRMGVDQKGLIKVARGNRAAEIRFNLPQYGKDQMKSIEALEKNKPTLRVPLYETTKPVQPTVEITGYNIHTGYVTVRAQRGHELYSNPYDTLYTNVSQKKNFL